MTSLTSIERRIHWDSSPSAPACGREIFPHQLRLPALRSIRSAVFFRKSFPLRPSVKIPGYERPPRLYAGCGNLRALHTKRKIRL